MTEYAKRKKISFTTLQAITEVLRCRSITKAACKLNISQPAMSGHLRRFEESLGYLPIRRVGNEMVITSSESIKIINQILALEKELSDIGKSHNSQMPKLGVCNFFGLCFVDTLENNPFIHTNFKLYINCSSVISEMFSYGNLDVIVRPVLNDEEPDFVYHQSIVWCGEAVVSNFPRKEPIKVILGSEKSSIGILARNWLDKNRISFSVVMESEDPAIVSKMCKTLGAIAPVPKYLVEKFDFKNIHVLPVVCDPFEVSIGMFLADRNISYLEAEKCFHSFLHVIGVDSPSAFAA